MHPTSPVSIPVPAMRQPKALFLLISVLMWECFSYYGMRALLVLYIVNQLHYADHRAFMLIAVYTSLVKLGGIGGGWVADRYLGSRRTLYFGAATILSGHMALAVPHSLFFFYLGLALIVVGTGLFKPNCFSLLGQLYPAGDPRCESGYRLCYIGANTGAFLAAIGCGYVGDYFGWHYGFGLAAIGMALGLACFARFETLLEEKGRPPAGVALSYTKIVAFFSIAVVGVLVLLRIQDITVHLLPFLILGSIAYIMWLVRHESILVIKRLALLLASIALLALFFAVEEQLGSSLMVFAERHMMRDLWGMRFLPVVLQR